MSSFNRSFRGGAGLGGFLSGSPVIRMMLFINVGVFLFEMLFGSLRLGGVPLEGKEALRLEVEHFVECIRNKHAPLSGGPEGLQLIRTLEAATQSLFLKGQPIPL